MNITGNLANDYRMLGFARHISATPGVTAESGKAMSVKYAKQNAVRETKFTKIAATILGK
jgi:hypothetical protein